MTDHIRSSLMTVIIIETTNVMTSFLRLEVVFMNRRCPTLGLSGQWFVGKIKRFLSQLKICEYHFMSSNINMYSIPLHMNLLTFPPFVLGQKRQIHVFFHQYTTHVLLHLCKPPVNVVQPLLRTHKSLRLVLYLYTTTLIQHASIM